MFGTQHAHAFFTPVAAGETAANTGHQNVALVTPSQRAVVGNNNQTPDHNRVINIKPLAQDLTAVFSGM
jgi:hypothetical protein